MRILILGGTGHLGAALCASAPADAVVTVMGRSASSPHVFDVLSPSQLPHSDIVIGAFPLARSLQERSDAAAVMARYVDLCGEARIVQLSTDAVFSGRRGLYGENDVPDPETTYGRAQVLVDTALAAARPRTLLVRTSFIFGCAGGRLDKRLAPLVSGVRPIAEQGWASNVYRSPTEVNFLAHGIWRALEAELSGPLNLCGPRLSIFDFFAKALGELDFTDFPPAIEQQDDAGRDTSLDATRMRRELALEQGENWEWFRRYLKEPRDSWTMVDSASVRSMT